MLLALALTFGLGAPPPITPRAMVEPKGYPLTWEPQPGCDVEKAKVDDRVWLVCVILNNW